MKNENRFELKNACHRESRRKGLDGKGLFQQTFSPAVQHHTTLPIMSAVSQAAKNYRTLLKHVKALPSAENWKGRVVQQVIWFS